MVIHFKKVAAATATAGAGDGHGKSPCVAIIYARSASSPDGGACERQIRECEAYAKRHRMTVLRRVSEVGGAGLNPSPGLVAAAAALSVELVDAVLMAQTSRFARDAAVVEVFAKIAKENGTVVVTVREQEDGHQKPTTTRSAKARLHVKRVVRRRDRRR